MASDCLFCKFVNKEIPVTYVYEDEHAIGIADIQPRAPQHYLLIPKQHVASALEIGPANALLAGNLVVAASRLAREKGLEKEGFRLVFNTGGHAGQTVLHLHLHLLGGRPLGGMV